MAQATPTTTMRRRHFPARTISRRHSAGGNSTIRRNAASSAKSGSGWTIGPSCGRSGDEMPIRNFDCFVGVDWSGARGSWQKGLKVAVAYPGIAAPLLQQPPDKNDKWSRAGFSHWLEELVQRQRVLVGLDFAF